MTVKFAELWRQAGHGEKRELARRLRISERTLRSWAQRLRRDGEPGRLGRPGHSVEARARVERLVAEQRTIQGNGAGWRPIAAALPEEPVRLIQAALSRQKRAQQAALSRRLVEHREGLVLLARDVIWGQDAAQFGRTSGHAIHGEVIRDLASTSTIALSAGRAATQTEIVDLLERAAKERGAYPLIWQSDNAKAYGSAYVEAYLARHRVVHLRSRPHTPTDNASSEHGIAELREESGLRPASPLDDALWATDRARAAIHTLDAGRRRASRGYKTAHQLDQDLPRAEHLTAREQFYERACTAMSGAVHGARSASEARARQRRALFDLLEECHLARRRLGAWRPEGPSARRRREAEPARMEP